MVKKFNGPKVSKPKITKDERRAKYTQIAKDRREKQSKRQWSKDLVCFKCREKGHTSSDCSKAGVLCYKCGSTEHSLRDCSEYRRGDKNMPFASCYFCDKKGHLASACPDNSKGLYVDGGGCRQCGSTRHISFECPENKKAKAPKEDVPEENFDDLLEGNGDSVGKAKAEEPEPTKKKRKVVTF
jgi:zinc finger CCHC domain-containing protein 9